MRLFNCSMLTRQCAFDWCATRVFRWQTGAVQVA